MTDEQHTAEFQTYQGLTRIRRTLLEHATSHEEHRHRHLRDLLSIAADVVERAASEAGRLDMEQMRRQGE